MQLMCFKYSYLCLVLLSRSALEHFPFLLRKFSIVVCSPIAHYIVFHFQNEYKKTFMTIIGKERRSIIFYVFALTVSKIIFQVLVKSS